MSLSLLALLLPMRALALGLGLALDAALGEPRRGHPLIGFGRFAAALERRLWRDSVAVGALTWGLAVLPAVLVAACLAALAWAVSPWLWLVPGTLGLYLAVGQRSLDEHARAVATPLATGDLAAARAAVAHLVSRDTAALDAGGIATAATESVLENGCDAVHGAMCWFLLLGLPGVVLYRLANTLDAMWGYRTPRHLRFGRVAARADDALNHLPARLCVLAYALAGRTRAALRCARLQGRTWKSPNAGPVMAAGAGALGLRLGGPAPYHGQWQVRPVLGDGAPPGANDIHRALALVRRASLIWLLAAMLVAGLVHAGCAHAEGVHVGIVHANPNHAGPVRAGLVQEVPPHA